MTDPFADRNQWVVILKHDILDFIINNTSEVLADGALFLRKFKAEFILTNQKTFGPSSFIIIKNKMLY